MNLNCPCCSKSLEVIKIQEVEIDYCKQGCKGIWFDKKEIIKITNQITANKDYIDLIGQSTNNLEDTVNPEAVKTCPKCNIKLTKTNKPRNSDIYIDLCKSCKGFWLDYGEIKALLKYFKTNKTAKTDFSDFVFDEIVYDLIALIAETVIDDIIDSL
ncbi:MAG: zf-TFIIB domain-containing protein [Cyanobacteriota bacterium]